MAKKTGKTGASGGGGRCKAPFEPAIGDYIGRELREIYDEVASQPVPKRFLTLLNALEGGTIFEKEVVETRED